MANPLADGIRDALSQDWAAFTAGLHEYAANSSASYALSDEDGHAHPSRKPPPSEPPKILSAAGLHPVDGADL